MNKFSAADLRMLISDTREKFGHPCPSQGLHGTSMQGLRIMYDQAKAEKASVYTTRLLAHETAVRELKDAKEAYEAAAVECEKARAALAVVRR